MTTTRILPLDSQFPGAAAAMTELEQCQGDASVLRRLSPRHWSIAWRIDTSHVVLAEVRCSDARAQLSDADTEQVRLICNTGIRIGRLEAELDDDDDSTSDVAAMVWPPTGDRRRRRRPQAAMRWSLGLTMASAVLALWVVFSALPDALSESAGLRNMTSKTLSHHLAVAMATGDYGEVQHVLTTFESLGYFQAAAVTNTRQKLVSNAGNLPDLRIGDVVSPNTLATARLLHREDPSVLLLDLMMPNMSGFDLLTAIRADRTLRYTPVIVLTAATGADSKLRALQLGATDFLAKPVDASELVLRVRNTLAFRQYHNHLLNYDQVTGLPNQRLFDRGIRELVAQRRTVGGMVVIFSIVVPECRQLRETIDQASADELAKVLARRLDRFASNENLASPVATNPERAPRVARLGAEHFGLALEGVPDAEAAEQLAKRVVAIITKPVNLGLHEVGPSAWVGISVSPTDGDSVEMLRKGADLAATHVQAQNATPFKFASAELHARSYERMALGSQLRQAARRGELRLHYQPKLDVASNRIIGAEALVRWQHPDHGLVPPTRFIALAEELGLIGSVGEWVIETACRDAVGWGAPGQSGLTVAVNVSKPQLTSGNLRAVLRDAMRSSGLHASQLVVEFTESMLMDDAASGLVLMRQLKDLGVTLSIDDFGTGYSSLSYLKQFPLDELKIDRSFVMDLPGGDTDVAIARTVIDLGHRLGMTVTAEGVETSAQLECLKREGCNNYQGFLYGKAVPAEKFKQVLAQCRSRASAIEHVR